MNKDQIKGTVKQAKGKVKEIAGEVQQKVGELTGSVDVHIRAVVGERFADLAHHP